MNKNLNKDFDHNAFATSKPETDFWGQIRRTVNGQPVSEEQILMIEQKICSSLNIEKFDHLLDLACGNGALSARLFPYCNSLLGVDFSEFLIDVAKKNFASPPNFEFLLNDVLNYLQNEKNYLKYNKAVCYGSFSYLPEEAAQSSLQLIQEKFENIEKIFIGNLPNLDEHHIFYSKKPPESPSELKCNTTSIGIWRTQSEFTELAENAGWKVEFSRMSNNFYSSAYRYDALLTR